MAHYDHDSGRFTNGRRTGAHRVPERSRAAVISLGVIVALAIAGAAALPIVRAKLRRSRDVLTLTGAVQNLKQCIIDAESWNATISDPKNPGGLRCTSEDAGCVGDKSVPVPRIMAGAYKLCLPGYDLTKPNVGLTEGGVRCETFSESGNSQCPYRLELSWVPRCVDGEKTCRNPAEELVFALAYRPTSKLEGTAPLLGDGVTRAGYGDRQTFALSRAERGLGSPVLIAEVMPPGVPGGPCKPGPVPTRRSMNTVLSDPEGFAATDRDGSFWLRQGQYDCRLSTPGFKVGAFRSFLVNLETQTPLLATSDEYTSSAFIAAQTRAEGSTRLNLTGAKTHLAVMQFCGEEPSGPPALKNLALGVPVGMGPELFTTLDCQLVPEDDL